MLLIYVQPFQPNPTAANVNALAGWMMNPNPSSSIQPHALVASSMPGLPHQGRVVLFSMPSSMFHFLGVVGCTYLGQ